jgi:hypothetical protein
LHCFDVSVCWSTVVYMLLEKAFQFFSDCM